MTDTGQIPGEGLPEDAGMVEQPGVPAPGTYTFLEPSENSPEEDDLLLMPGAQGAWSDQHAAAPQAGHPQGAPAADQYASVPAAAHHDAAPQHHSGEYQMDYAAYQVQDYGTAPAVHGAEQAAPAPAGTAYAEQAAAQDAAAPAPAFVEVTPAAQAAEAAVPPQEPQFHEVRSPEPQEQGFEAHDAQQARLQAQDAAAQEPLAQVQGTMSVVPGVAPADPAAVAGEAGPAGGHAAPVAQEAPAVQPEQVPAAQESGAHEAGGRDSGAVDLGAVRTPAAATSAMPTPARRPLHMGPPVPDTSSGVVRSLADRGPAGTPPHPMVVRTAAAPAAATTGVEYLDVPREEPGAELPGPQLGEIPPQAGAPWDPQPPQEQTPVAAPAAPAETVVPSDAAAEAANAEATVPAPRTGGSEQQPAAEAEPSVAPEAPEPQLQPEAEVQTPAVVHEAAPGPVEPAEPEAVVRETVTEPVAEQPAVEPPATPEAVVPEAPAEAPKAQQAPAPAVVSEPEPEPVAVAPEAGEAVAAAEAAPVEAGEPSAEVPTAPAEAPAPAVPSGEATAAPAAEALQAAALQADVPQDEAPQAQAPEADTQAPEAASPQAQAPEAVAPQEAPQDEAPQDDAAQAPASAAADPSAPPVADAAPTGTAAVEEGGSPEPQPAAPTAPAPGYDDAEREAVLRVMRERRDIRNGFRSDPIPHEVLLRVLEAAHTAPSVGHSQPWDFVVIRSAETRRTMHELAQRQREAYAKSLPKGRAKQFKELKIEAILDTPVNIVVTADPTRGGRHTLGRHTQPQMAPYSSALAVENLWLAARAEGLGVGWVSFFDEREMVRTLGLPEHLEVVAYLCVGYVDEFPEEPELMQAGWSKRRPLSWVVHEETYGRRALPGEEPHDLLQETVTNIRPLDAKALGEAWERQKRMTKPSGALGMLEIISAQLSGLSRMCPPPIPEPAAVAIFAGDHGVHAQGVTAWPQEVTGQMVANFLGGGAVCNAFANQVGAEVCVIDVGVASELPATPGLLPRKVRPGTADFTTGPALSREEVLSAIEVGIETARDLVAAGNKALLTGEMGIANTTASAALISVYTGADPSEITGRGTGINDEMHARKVDVVRRALELHQPDPADPIGVLAAVGGLEHCALVGLILGGASLRTPVILDGVSTGAAALVARAVAPEALAACIAGHRSAEPGHVAALNKLGLRPLVDLDLRLGEGTGALLALPVVQSAARAMHEVATFDSAGVTEK
ncbi:nicotinate-nucleotide--dimethylbenzimidazole phosphoribosyltransferase [Streptomyces pristinaespiralis]|uniref:Nicotinate-nucleotide--dimethylbenzimidazole phosphoribosyltransferase n=1 Tax=Streptomyces pristinaespiralis TaxID=38300 RepID=A0A0M4DAP9_STRPR|nr:nicotinate-nucleotide--dimethylbenzimidazole phosphoribosyltransferase [Streptomyces pristinaespiralis]ALC24316.1 nicotinate-nucleotide--dimethylbenzimidazole phosphoribosyltransferase [Streptomyces pristinaespiralis]QMU13320.1 nicotinate-nucleotide--dimethylbenzimidazole phosphoribosyltransferase [Streptomyces pristinaespiralis]